MSLFGTGRNGELKLTFGRRAAQTTLAERYSRPPLQVMRAIPDSAGCLCVYLLSPSGGVVQNDQYQMQICLSTGTHALLTTPAATRVYRMPDGCAEQQLDIVVGEQAIFEYVPDATILFADSDFRQTINIVLEPGALLLFQDIIMPGRLARQEKLQFRQYVNRLVVRDDRGLLLYDQARIVPSAQSLDSAGFLQSYSSWGNFYLLGDLAGRGIDAAAFCQAHHATFSSDDSTGSMSRLHRNGIAVRMVSQRLETITAAFENLRLAVRDCLGMPHERLRK